MPMKVEHHFIPIDFVVLEMGERENPPIILGRPFLKTVGAMINIGKGEIKFDINDERSSFKFRPRFEVCNMIKVKYIPPHHCVSKEEPKKKKELEKKETLYMTHPMCYLLLSRNQNQKNSEPTSIFHTFNDYMVDLFYMLKTHE
jgi:hypothetical protein